MTERRTTITVGWRPQGAPARRIDDFQEAPTESAREFERRKQPQRQVERRSIGRRLENWGMWANMRGSRGPDSMTGLVCENMLRNSKDALKLLPPKPLPAGHRIDVVDAERINAALPDIDERHLGILQWTYVSCLESWAVANACGFPKREYDQRLAEAQAAIECIVGKNEEAQG